MGTHIILYLGIFVSLAIITQEYYRIIDITWSIDYYIIDKVPNDLYLSN